MAAGSIMLLLINTTPLSHLGLSIQLPMGWENASTGIYSDSSCSQRNAEGLPFAFKRPNSTESCSFDSNMFAFTLNVVLGAGIGLIYVITTERWGQKNERQQK